VRILNHVKGKRISPQCALRQFLQERMTENLRVDVTVGIPEFASETAVGGEYATEGQTPKEKTPHGDLAFAG